MHRRVQVRAVVPIPTLPGVDTIAQAVQDKARGLMGMRLAPKYPPEQANEFPFAITYPRGGTLRLEWGNTLINEMELVTEIHLTGPDLATASERAYPYLERFLKALLDDFTLGATFSSTSAGNLRLPIRHRFGFLDYFGGQTIGWEFEIPVVARGDTS